MKALEQHIFDESWCIDDSKSFFDVIRWKWDFENLYRDVLLKISKQKIEYVYILTQYIDWTFKFERIASWESWEVQFDPSKLRPIRWIAHYTIYHNHPPWGNSTSSPPSSDDFITATKIRWDITHKVIVESGIWQFRITDVIKSRNIANKLGTLLNYLIWNDNSIEAAERMKILNKMGMHYWQAAYSYKWLLENKDEIDMYILIFKASMQEFGFYVDYKPYSR